MEKRKHNQGEEYIDCVINEELSPPKKNKQNTGLSDWDIKQCLLKYLINIVNKNKHYTTS
jgi:hypothetical protein